MVCRLKGWHPRINSSRQAVPLLVGQGAHCPPSCDEAPEPTAAMRNSPIPLVCRHFQLPLCDVGIVCQKPHAAPIAAQASLSLAQGGHSELHPQGSLGRAALHRALRRRGTCTSSGGKSSPGRWPGAVGGSFALLRSSFAAVSGVFTIHLSVRCSVRVIFFTAQLQ